jgi:hypothetical protein
MREKGLQRLTRLVEREVEDSSNIYHIFPA